MAPAESGQQSLEQADGIEEQMLQLLRLRFLSIDGWQRLLDEGTHEQAVGQIIQRVRALTEVIEASGNSEISERSCEEAIRFINLNQGAEDELENRLRVAAYYEILSNLEQTRDNPASSNPTTNAVAEGAEVPPLEDRESSTAEGVEGAVLPMVSVTYGVEATGDEAPGSDSSTAPVKDTEASGDEHDDLDIDVAEVEELEGYPSNTLILLQTDTGYKRIIVLRCEETEDGLKVFLKHLNNEGDVEEVTIPADDLKFANRIVTEKTVDPSDPDSIPKLLKGEYELALDNGVGDGEEDVDLAFGGDDEPEKHALQATG